MSVLASAGSGDSFDNHDPSNISVEWSLRKTLVFSCACLPTVYIIVIFINSYKYIKVHHRSNI